MLRLNFREHTFMTSTWNTRKYDPPPSPIHMRPQFSKISGTPLPLNADADVSFFVLEPPLPKKNHNNQPIIYNNWPWVKRYDDKSLKNDHLELINPKCRVEKSQIHIFLRQKIKIWCGRPYFTFDPPPSPHLPSSTIRNFGSELLTPLPPCHVDVIYVCSLILPSIKNTLNGRQYLSLQIMCSFCPL